MNCDYNCNGYVNNPFGCGGCNTCGYTPIMGGFGCNNTGCSWFAIVPTQKDFKTDAPELKK